MGYLGKKKKGYTIAEKEGEKKRGYFTGGGEKKGF